MEEDFGLVQVAIPLDVSKPKQIKEIEKKNPLELRKLPTSVYALEELQNENLSTSRKTSPRKVIKNIKHHSKNSSFH